MSVSSRWSFLIFGFTLLAFVVESELTQHLQTTLEYRQPFFTFYLVHSAFAIIFPLHLLYLQATTKYTINALWNGLILALKNHITPGTAHGFPRSRFLLMIGLLTCGISFPGLLWFAAISLASVSDVTGTFLSLVYAPDIQLTPAIWNANAFFAYLMTFKGRWEPRRLFAVSIATIGVLVVVYGGSTSTVDVTEKRSSKPSAPLVGDLLTLVASVGYALYQVLYKKYAALSSDPEVMADRAYEHLPTSEDVPVPVNLDPAEAIYPPPFGLHPNLLTSAIGVCTFSVFWIFIPILHYLDIERFVLPNTFPIIFTIFGISLSGVIFNAGFMVLLGVWGPIITSVGNLLTIVLVFVSDILFGAGVEAVTFGGVGGCALIVVAFGVLVFDMLDKTRPIR
ncbi:hypothetical protein MIND_00483400 [Mycena indigotica]|uniref:EamA domain-containing protein n=1 Tax=Mycena indigotica TaxID=2126181 RepID=A0A8H6WC26_9AGAR|nr:uncharacterized protein MIND_00483400 [Mycena indigotica]KAF7306909.1 hypothetical protein MIND_00483400 [Mycena indigotica]